MSSPSNNHCGQKKEIVWLSTYGYVSIVVAGQSGGQPSWATWHPPPTPHPPKEEFRPQEKKIWKLPAGTHLRISLFRPFQQTWVTHRTPLSTGYLKYRPHLSWGLLGAPVFGHFLLSKRVNTVLNWLWTETRLWLPSLSEQVPKENDFFSFIWRPKPGPLLQSQFFRGGNRGGGCFFLPLWKPVAMVGNLPLDFSRIPSLVHKHPSWGPSPSVRTPDALLHSCGPASGHEFSEMYSVQK